jgi:hypothetical protein
MQLPVEANVSRRRARVLRDGWGVYRRDDDSCALKRT